MLKSILIAACALSLAACADGGGGVSSAGSTAVAAVADATLPPPSVISPTAKTTIDDALVDFAWDALDTTQQAAVTLIVLKPTLAGSPAAIKLADAMEGAANALTTASRIQRGLQAGSYKEALAQAQASLQSATVAMAQLRGMK